MSNSQETKLYALLLKVEETLFTLKEVGVKDRDYDTLHKSTIKVIDKLNKKRDIDGQDSEGSSGEDN